MQEQWLEISRKLQESLDSGVYKVWIAPLHGDVQGDRLTLRAPSAFVANWLRTRLLGAIRDAAAAVLRVDPGTVSVDVLTGSREEATSGGEKSAAGAAAVSMSAAGGLDNGERCGMTTTAASESASVPAAPLLTTPQVPSQQYLPLGVASFSRPRNEWRHSFDDFVVGPSNNVAVAAAQDVCRSSGCVSTLFISAPPGLGKTHVSQAVGQTMFKAGLGSRVGYLTAEDFAARFVSALRTREVDEFKARLRQLDVLLLEDVHFLRGKEKIQDMVLSVVKHLQEYGGRVVFTSTFSPRELQQVDSQLVSHFCSGIVSAITRPDEDMRREILERKARSWQVMLPAPVCDLLANRLQGDVRQLESCLNSLVFKARLLNCNLNTELALEVLSQYADVECGPDFDAIVRLVCESFGLTQKQLASPSRRQELVLARNTIYYLARKHTEMSLAEIGSRFNRRHTTVIKGISSVERELCKETRVGRQIARAVSLIERNAGMCAQA
ncbi:MAG: DnaA/Hda family protein [Desulfovibrio sp.]|uniref:DnaA ATPase domain-containing protein n=1 Tax=Desulfovibrio sp. TaxID=885 RepID=UPI0025BFBB4B|nr:DnaA/Hda family protein [Desulfovibrio sp.]MCI7568602.1 DnaA/Hda family protein [Desulfovibrio sp.]